MKWIVFQISSSSHDDASVLLSSTPLERFGQINTLELFPGLLLLRNTSQPKDPFVTSSDLPEAGSVKRHLLGEPLRVCLTWDGKVPEAIGDLRVHVGGDVEECYWRD